MALNFDDVLNAISNENFDFDVPGIPSDKEEDLDRRLEMSDSDSSDEEPVDEEDDDSEVDDEDPDWEEGGDLGEGSGGRGRSPIRRRADSPNGTSGNGGRGSSAKGSRTRGSRARSGKSQHEAPSQNGLGYDVVMKLVNPYLGQGYHVYFDNFFTSPKLVEYLFMNGTPSSGTGKDSPNA
ncbi:Hypothetical predicted protein [Paramuricea clavata]|uniref:Uncharacterized protein n=1 Tax=Paramuricea clavata TaxID=317549 RepID=A0A6S7FYQ3_PARCT|nr:Hypothetical predicted protein [Paramuricea clavata]